MGTGNIPNCKSSRQESAEHLSDAVRRGEELSRERLVPEGSNLEQLAGSSMPVLRERCPVRRPLDETALDHVQGRASLSAEQLEASEITSQVLNNLARYIQNHRNADNPTLRDPQIGVVEDLRQFYERGGTWGYLKLPTGSGKTVVFAEVTEALGLPTLVLVPKITLGQQTKEKFDRFAPDLHVTCKFGNEDRTDGRVVITTYQYLPQAVSEGKLDISPFKLIIMDEAHKGIGPGMRRVLDQIPDSTRVLAVTATPRYNYGKYSKSLDSEVGECISELSITDAVRMGMLTPISVVVAKTTVDLSAVPQAANGKYENVALGRKLMEAGVNRACLEMYQRAFAGKSGVGFCASIEHAKAAAAEFKKAGIAAEPISSEDNVARRVQLIAAFKRGEIKMLFSADMLIEGFDSENATVCFNLVPTGSLVSAEQRAGRVFRLDPNDPDKVGVVVEFVYSDHHRTAPVILFSEIINGTACPAGAEEREGVREKREKLESALAAVQFEGLQVLTDAETIMQVTATLQPNRYLHEPPSGWLSLLDAVALTEMTASAFQRTVLTIEAELGPDHEPLQGRYRRGSGDRVATFYSPEALVQVNNYHNRNNVPEGWIPVSKAALQMQMNISRIEPYLRRVAEAEGLARICRGNRGRALTFYSPECLERVGTLIAAEPSEWPRITASTLAENSKVPDWVVKDILSDLMKELSPLVIKEIGGRSTVLKAHPTVEAIVAQRCTEWRGTELNGPVTVESLASELEIDPRCVTRHLEERRRGEDGYDRPASTSIYQRSEEGVDQMQGRTSNTKEISAEDASMIRRMVWRERLAPEDWMNGTALEQRYRELVGTTAGFKAMYDTMCRRLPDEWKLEMKQQVDRYVAGIASVQEVVRDHHHPKFVAALLETKRRALVESKAKKDGA